MSLAVDSPEGQGWLARLTRVLKVIEDAVLVILLGGMIVLAVAQIVLRNLFSSGLIWGDALLRLTVLWVGLLGAMAATRDDRQISINALARVLPERWQSRMRVVTDLFASSVCLFLAFHAVRLILDDRSAGAIAFAGVPVWICEIVVPIALVVIGLRYLAFAWHHAMAWRSGGAG